MSVKDICRLCLTSDNLVWIFDKRIQSPGNMKDIIFITTGVEIFDNDFVSQKICSDCCQMTLRMFKFRSMAIKNDQKLKARYAILLDSGNGKVSLPIEKKIKQEDPKDKISCDQNLTTNESQTDDKEVDIHEKLKEISCDVNLATVQSHGKTLMDHKSNLHCNIDSGPVYENRTYFIKTSNKKNSVDIQPTAVTKVHLAKKKTAKKFIKPKTETRRVPPLIISRSAIVGIKSGEPPTKLLKLSDSTSRTESTVSESVPSNIRPVVQNNELLTKVEKSHGLFTCTICSSVHRSQKNLKLHQRKHLRCHFCKITLKSLSSRDVHLEQCIVRKAMVSIPDLGMFRIEDDINLVKKYPEVSKTIQKLVESNNKGPENSRITTSCPDNEQSTFPPAVKCINNEVIDLSNECDIEESSAQNFSAKTTILRDILEFGVSRYTKSVSNTSKPLQRSNLNQFLLSDKEANNESPCIVIQDDEKLSVKEIESFKSIEPDIRIGNKLLPNNLPVSDIQRIKLTLKNCKRKPVQKNTSHEILQTQSPVEIITDTLNNTCDFKHLNRQITTWKIPLQVCGSNSLSIRHKDHIPQKSDTKYRHYWNHLKPIDLEAGKSIKVSRSQTDDTISTSIINRQSLCNDESLRNNDINHRLSMAITNMHDSSHEFLYNNESPLHNSVCQRLPKDVTKRQEHSRQSLCDDQLHFWQSSLLPNKENCVVPDSSPPQSNIIKSAQGSIDYIVDKPISQISNTSSKITSNESILKNMLLTFPSKNNIPAI